MKNESHVLKPVSRKRLEAQGYCDFTDKELVSFRFGIRFAYALCTILFGLGLASSNVTLLIVAATVAFLGAFPPYHPFDYLYNYVVRHLLNKPKLPPRSNQGRFACGMGSVWLITIILLLDGGNVIAANILGFMLLLVAILVTTMDICIPSMVYNFLFKKKIE